MMGLSTQMNPKAKREMTGQSQKLNSNVKGGALVLKTKCTTPKPIAIEKKET